MPAEILIAPGDRGPAVRDLHADLRTLGFALPSAEVQGTLYGAGTRTAVADFQTSQGLPRTGLLDEPTRAGLKRAVASAAAGQNQVEGRVLLENGTPAARLHVRLYQLQFGGGQSLLGETRTDGRGFYAIAYDAAIKKPNLELRCVDAAGAEVSLSEPILAGSPHEMVNLVAPASLQPLTPEFRRLTADLLREVGTTDRLAESREDDSRQDVSFLRQSTGWDARIIAARVMAARIAAPTRIPEEALYGLARVGLPTEERHLARVTANAVSDALGRARDAGIIGLDDAQIRAAVTSFRNFARDALRKEKAPGTLSTTADMLSRARLDPAQQAILENALAARRDTDGDLWAELRSAGMPAAEVDGLRMQGKLAFLTLDNAVLTESLQAEFTSPDDLAGLVDAGLHTADAWKTRLKEAAGGDDAALEALIPPAYRGDSTASRLDRYGADLARKVRLSYPMRIVARMIADDELRLGANHAALKTPVERFLRNAEPLGFQLGQQPVERFVRANEAAVFQGIPQNQRDLVTAEMKTLARLYQISPSNQSLVVLLDAGFTSAHDVILFSAQDFLLHYGTRFPSEAEAKLTYRKAKQVSLVTFNFYTAAQQLESAPPVFAISGPAQARATAKEELLRNYPTMQSLFGALDFCECEHCRSVLSPAAYLVDLLRFLDAEELVWSNMMKHWRDTHAGEDYPHTDPVTGAPLRPYDVLTRRRPDLPHLPLTCENTHTALPYIDVVNEILEYTTARGSLDAGAARDTGSATTAELIAEPQNIVAEAYDTLRDKAKFPVGLPFDLWLETVRAFFQHFDSSLAQLLEVLRPTHALFDTTAPYDRAAVFSELLGLAPVERALFTDADPLDGWWQLYGYSDATEAADQLKSARTLANRLGVTYEELAQLVRTGFLNPRLQSLAVLRELDMDARTVFRYKSHPAHPPLTAEEAADFEAKLDALSGRFANIGFDARAWLDAAWDAGEFGGILVLADPDAGCSFDLTTLQYIDGAPASALDFHRLNLFVRLWRRVGWRISELDAALQAFWPASAMPPTAASLGEAFDTVLIRLSHLKELAGRVRVGRDGLPKLVALWSDLATTAARPARPLYAQLFLTRSVLDSDAVFDHPLGRYLEYFDAGTSAYTPFTYDPAQQEDVQAGNVGLKNHLLAVQAALGITHDDVRGILLDAGPDLETAPLTLSNVSLLHRYALLARGLRLSIAELIELKGMAGVDPFEPLGAAPLSTLDGDHARSRTLAFVDIAERVKDSALKVEDIAYILRHRYDRLGKYAEDPGAFITLVRTLKAALQRIEAEHALPTDAATFSDEVLRQKAALVLPADVVEIFMGMWSGTAEFEAVQEGVLPADALDPADFAGEPDVDVRYDDVRQAQRLTYHGVLLDAREAALTAAHPQPLVATLLARAKADARAFFDRQLGGFLDPSDYDKLFAPMPAGLTDEQIEAEMRSRRAALASAFLPYLQGKLKRRFVIETLAAGQDVEPGLVSTLLTDAALLEDPAQQDAPVIEAFTGLATPGVTARFYASPDASGAATEVRTVDDVSTAQAPAGTGSASFEGHLEVATPGAYRFFVQLESQGAGATLHFDHLTDPLLRATAPSAEAEVSEFIELKHGVPYGFQLEARHLGGGAVRLLVQGEGLARNGLSRLALYPREAVERARRAHVLLTKVLQLIGAFSLNEREIRHLVGHAADFDELDLSRLPTRSEDDSPTAAEALFRQFLRLSGYASLRQRLTGGSVDLIGVFEKARRGFVAGTDATAAHTQVLDEVTGRIADLLRQEAITVREAAALLGYGATSAVAGNELRVEAPAFANEIGISRLVELLRLAEALRVPVASLARWATPTPGYETARDLRDTVKSRYPAETWRRVAQPVFDGLRQKQRDALVAHLMHRDGYERADQLYEYFLVDPGMEPVVQTSRLRLAISSVQLFVQRCLLNLEPQVHPSMIRSDHWLWMKRYRVWEANRKIFLFPENWLEPEFRDDRTHLFLELEGALLQGDVSEDLAEDAFFGYLSGLDRIARLEMVTMYLDEKPDPASNALHVIGRTYEKPHRYFYRTYAHNMWTPWEPVGVDIESDHIVAVMWRDRLHLFWVTFLEKATDEADANKSPSDMGDEPMRNLRSWREIEIQLNWSEYFDGEWTERASTGFDEPMRVKSGYPFNSGDTFIHATKEYQGGVESAVKIRLWFHFSGAWFLPSGTFTVTGRNAPPVIETVPFGGGGFPDPPYGWSGWRATRMRGSSPFTVTFEQREETTGGGEPEVTVAKWDILEKGGAYSFIWYPSQVFDDEVGRLVSPFFYQAGTETFYVEPTLTEKTIKEWDDWIITAAAAQVPASQAEVWGKVTVQATAPVFDRIDPADLGTLSTRAKIPIKESADWLTASGTLVRFGERLVDGNGGLDPRALSSAGFDAARGSGAIGSREAHAGRLGIVGSGGIDAVLARNIELSDRINLNVRNVLGRVTFPSR